MNSSLLSLCKAISRSRYIPTPEAEEVSPATTRAQTCSPESKLALLDSIRRHLLGDPEPDRYDSCSPAPAYRRSCSFGRLVADQWAGPGEAVPGGAAPAVGEVRGGDTGDGQKRGQGVAGDVRHRGERRRRLRSRCIPDARLPRAAQLPTAARVGGGCAGVYYSSFVLNLLSYNSPSEKASSKRRKKGAAAAIITPSSPASSFGSVPVSVKAHVGHLLWRICIQSSEKPWDKSSPGHRSDPAMVMAMQLLDSSIPRQEPACWIW
ncbi:hypothetical protein GW17_00018917 [Ensete ventricosum]|nr:hypothetical protein GW17_00018917 [Ensete ventricosum]